MEKILCPPDCSACCRGPMDIFLSSTEAKRRILAGQKIRALLPHTETRLTPHGIQEIPVDHASRKEEYQKGARIMKPGTKEHRIVDAFATMTHVLKPGETIYEAESDCPFIGEDNLCGVYDERDRMCQEFEAGSKACVKGFRGGEEIPITLTKKSSPVP